MRWVRSATRTGILLAAAVIINACADRGAPPANAPSVPAAPTSLTLSPADGALNASWVLPEGASTASPNRTIVEYAVSDRTSWSRVTASTPSTVTIPNLENFTPTWIRVARANAQGQSAWLRHDSPTAPRPPSTAGPQDDPRRAPAPGTAFTDSGSGTSTPTLTLEPGRIRVEQHGITTLSLVTSASDVHVPTFYAGSSVPFRITGFAPGSVMEVVLHSEPQSLGLHAVTLSSTDASPATGVATGNVVIPRTLEPGDHGLHFRGRTQDGSPLRLGLGVTARPHPSGITHVTLAVDTIAIEVGATLALEDVGATVHGNHEGDTGVTWTVADPRIAAVEEDGVVGVDVGTTTLVAAATAAPSIRAEATVTVSDTSPELGSLTVTVDQPGTTVRVRGDDVELVEIVDDAFTWALAPGTYTVTASKLGFSAPEPNSAVVTRKETTTVALSLTRIVDPFTMHVSQHVLTWPGSHEGTATLPPFRSAWSAGEPFLATVHLRFTNLEDAPMTTVRLTNDVPEALGVVESSITRAGTYDASTHTISWSNPHDGAELPVGASVDVSFDVYARQQPGVPWEGAFNPDAAVPAPAASGRAAPPHIVSNPAFRTVVFNDPYRIVNGANAHSVEAVATVDSRTEPHVWSATPSTDEGDIWVVRPLFDLDVHRGGALMVSAYDFVTFSTTVQQIDRVSTTIDPAWTEYAFLDVLYPWEFGGSLDGGTGHVPRNAATRSNPHARDVTLFNSFEVGLDFNRATDVDGGDIGWTGVDGRDVTYSKREQLTPGAAVTVDLDVLAQISSDESTDDSTPESKNGARYVVDLEDRTFRAHGTSGAYGWLTCGYVGSPQLWQPNANTTDFTQDSIYELHASGSYPSIPQTSPASSALWSPLDQVSASQGIDPMGLVGHPSGVTRIPSHAGVASVDGLLEQCTAVVVEPHTVPDPILGLSIRGNYGGAHPDAQALGTSFDRDDAWFHHVGIDNPSTTTATDVDLSLSITDTAVLTFDDALPGAYVSTDGGQSWTVTPNTTPTTLLPNRIAFDDLTIPSGGRLNVAMGVQAVGEGSSELSAKVTHDRSDGPQTLVGTHFVSVVP